MAIAFLLDDDARTALKTSIATSGSALSMITP
jgi:hypothetical protein